MDFLSLHELIQCCQVEAIANRLDPTIISRYKDFCREYSRLFSTPYHLVLEFDPEFVISTVLDERLDGIDIDEKMEDLMDRVYSIEDPNYEKSKEQDLQAFIDQSLEEEQERLKQGRPVFQKTKKSISKKEEPLKEKLPTGGYVNLSYLENLDKEE